MCPPKLFICLGAIRTNKIPDALRERVLEVALTTQDEATVMWKPLLQVIQVAAGNHVNDLT
jgi:hypothetical protein